MDHRDLCSNHVFDFFLVAFLKGHDDVALVQTRWAFVNKDENLLTRLQNINLAFHFEVEQQVNGWFINFFGFNGTAGVWRIKALEECGGWLERTTVEDMDIAVRAHLCGWKFIYVNDVKVCKFLDCLLVSFYNNKFSKIWFSSCSASVNYQNHTRHIRSSNTGGILVQCNFFACVSLTYCVPRFVWVFIVKNSFWLQYL